MVKRDEAMLRSSKKERNTLRHHDQEAKLGQSEYTADQGVEVSQGGSRDKTAGEEQKAHIRPRQLVVKQWVKAKLEAPWDTNQAWYTITRLQMARNLHNHASNAWFTSNPSVSSFLHHPIWLASMGSRREETLEKEQADAATTANVYGGGWYDLAQKVQRPLKS